MEHRIVQQVAAQFISGHAILPQVAAKLTAGPRVQQIVALPDYLRSIAYGYFARSFQQCRTTPKRAFHGPLRRSHRISVGELSPTHLLTLGSAAAQPMERRILQQVPCKIDAWPGVQQVVALLAHLNPITYDLLCSFISAEGTKSRAFSQRGRENLRKAGLPDPPLCNMHFIRYPEPGE